MFFPRPDVLERHTSRVHSAKKLTLKSVACLFCDATLPRLQDFHAHANVDHLEVKLTSESLGSISSYSCPLFCFMSYETRVSQLEGLWFNRWLSN